MISSLVPALISAFKARRELALENVALRQQLAVLRRSVKRPRLSKVDRGFWVLLRRIWTDWESVLVIVKPETVVRWHRCGFRRYWTWKSRRRRPSNFEDLISQGRARPFEIEHIWEDQYDRFKEWYAHPSDFETARNRLGGLVLLQRGVNQSLGDAPYEAKRNAYVSNSENLLARCLGA